MNPEQTLRFTKIYLKNWRNFGEVEVALPRRAFLVGPNASGKTNFLDALRFLAEIATLGTGGLLGAINRRGGFANIHRHSAKQDEPITIKVMIGNDDTPQSWEYELTFTEEGKKELSIIQESVSQAGQKLFSREVLASGVTATGEYLVTNDVRISFEDYGLLQRVGRAARTRINPIIQTYIESEEWRNLISELSDFVASVRHFNVVPELVRHADWRGNTENGYNDYIEQIANTPKPEQKRKLAQIQEVLRGTVPQFKNLDIALGTFDVPHLYANYANWRGKNTRETEASFSDGTLRLIGLLWSVMDGDGPLLVEEPEISLHYGIVRFIPQMLERLGYSTGRQVIVSTHSTDLLVDEGIRPDEVLLFRPEKRGTTITPASSISEMKTLVEGGFNLGMIVQSSTAPVEADAIAYFDPIAQVAAE